MIFSNYNLFTGQTGHYAFNNSEAWRVENTWTKPVNDVVQTGLAALAESLSLSNASLVNWDVTASNNTRWRGQRAERIQAEFMMNSEGMNSV